MGIENVQFHEAANIFPLMTGDDFDGLVEDIRKHGLQLPIETIDGLIIDGRNRYRACLQAGVSGLYEAVKTNDPVAYVMSRNLHRRHMTPSQLALVAGKAREFYDKAAKERQKKHGETAPGKNTSGKVTGSDNGDSRDQAGRAVGVSGSLVDRASKVLDKGQKEIVEAVEAGKMSVSKAAKVVELPPDEQKEIAKSAVFSGGRYRDKSKDKPEQDPVPGKDRGVGVLRANEAIDALKRIPKNDGLRKRGFQIVSDWIKANK